MSINIDFLKERRRLRGLPRTEPAHLELDHLDTSAPTSLSRSSRMSKGKLDNPLENSAVTVGKHTADLVERLQQNINRI